MKHLSRLLKETFRLGDSMSHTNFDSFERKIVKDRNEDINLKLKSIAPHKTDEGDKSEVESDIKQAEDENTDGLKNTSSKNQFSLEKLIKDGNERKKPCVLAMNWKDKMNGELQKKRKEQMIRDTVVDKELISVKKIEKKIYDNKILYFYSEEPRVNVVDDTCVKEVCVSRNIEEGEIYLDPLKSVRVENIGRKINKSERRQFSYKMSDEEWENEDKLVRDMEIQEKQDKEKNKEEKERKEEEKEANQENQDCHKDLDEGKDCCRPEALEFSITDSLGLGEIPSYWEETMMLNYLDDFSLMTVSSIANALDFTASVRDFTENRLSSLKSMTSLCRDKGFTPNKFIERQSSYFSFVENDYCSCLELRPPTCFAGKYEKEPNLFSMSLNILVSSMASKCESKALTELYKSLNVTGIKKKNTSFVTLSSLEMENYGKKTALAAEISLGIMEGDSKQRQKFNGEPKWKETDKDAKEEKEKLEKEQCPSLGQNTEENFPGRSHRKNLNKKSRNYDNPCSVMKNVQKPGRKKQIKSKKADSVAGKKKKKCRSKEMLPRKAFIKRKHLEDKNGGLCERKNLKGKRAGHGREKNLDFKRRGPSDANDLKRKGGGQRRERSLDWKRGGLYDEKNLKDKKRGLGGEKISSDKKTVHPQQEKYQVNSNGRNKSGKDHPLKLRSERGKERKTSNGGNNGSSGNQRSGNSGRGSSSGSKRENLPSERAGESGAKNGRKGSGDDDNRDRKQDKNNYNDKFMPSEKQSMEDEVDSAHLGKNENPIDKVGRVNQDPRTKSNRHRNVSPHGDRFTGPSLPPPVLDDLTLALRRSTEDKMGETLQQKTDDHNTFEEQAHENVCDMSGTNDAVLPVSEPEKLPDLQHATISVSQLCDIIGVATRERPPYTETTRSFNICLEHIMHDLSFSSANGRSDEMTDEECTICLVLSRMMTHMANQAIHAAQESSCDQCTQVFNIITWHAVLCIQTKRKRKRLSPSDLCYKICTASNWDVEKLNCTLDRLKCKVRKYCAKVLCSYAEARQEESSEGLGEIGPHPFTETLSTGLSSATSRPSGTSMSINGNIVAEESTPEENEQVPNEQLPFATFMETPGQTVHASSIQSHSVTQSNWNRTMAVMPNVSNMPSTGGTSDMAAHPKLIRKSSQRRTPAIPQPIVEESPATLEHSASESALADSGRKDEIEDIIYKRQGRRIDERYSTQQTYGNVKNYDSLPMGNVHDVEQFMSLWLRPTGVPGVGEVVFGHPNQLRIVAGFWNRKREDCERTRNCPYQHREEGVVLAKYREHFSILRTRYQKHQQWERVAHLGNGMSGKCHLAMDLKTNFKFCCKKIHLLRYAEEELSLWSEMQNPYIVKLYGAIRHGVKIYIFSEFIDGGNLASCIEEQKRLGRRLSHWSAISYFQQLLKVLAYLQTKNILHEDIKADNIILRRDTTFIAVTDFGTSRRLQDPKELKNKSPVGSPTHWSPEKASMEGHGFPSDLWAAVCVLIHMLSGAPPWVQRYLQRAAILNYIIYAKPPPMEDVPKNVQTVVRDLIEKGLVKDPQLRPSPTELLNHPAFKILDQGNPETYFSTLMSTAHGVMGTVRPSEDAGETQSEKLPVTSSEPTVLYSGSIKSRPFQESDSRAEHLENKINESKELDESEKVDQDTREETETEDVEEAKPGGLQAEDAGKDTSDERNLEQDNTSPQSVTQVTEKGNTSRKVSELLEPQALDLLPRFNELFDADENGHSIKSFYEDNLRSSGDVTLTVRRQIRLTEYKPEEKAGNHLPNLSLFDRSLHNSSQTGDGSYGSLAMSAIPVLEQDELPSAQYRKKLTTLPVKFQLSSESDDCTSADLFESGPNPNVENDRNENPQADSFERSNSRESPRDRSDSQRGTVVNSGEISPALSTGSSSSTGRSHIQQKNWLKLNVTCAPGPKAPSPSQSESQQGSSSGTAEVTKSSTFLPASSRTPFTPRKSNTTSSSNLSSSPFFKSSSVIEDANKMMVDFQDELEELSQISSSTSDRLQELHEHEYDIGEQGAEVTLCPSDGVPNIEAFLDTIRGEIDVSSLGGSKLTFYNEDGTILFVVRMREYPIYWKDLMRIVRTKMNSSGNDHFIILHMDGTPVELGLPLLDNQELKVKILPGMGRGCFCEKCAYLE